MNYLHGISGDPVTSFEWREEGRAVSRGDVTRKQ